jgi:ATP-binding cassette, subfamily F, member 3
LSGGVSTSASSNGNNGKPEPKKRLNPIKRKQIEERVQELEAEIGKTESAIAELEVAQQNFVSAEESQRQSQELDQRKATHAAMVAEWEEKSESLQASD